MLLTKRVEFNTNFDAQLVHFLICDVLVPGTIKCILKIKKKKILFESANREEGWILSWG